LQAQENQLGHLLFAWQQHGLAGDFEKFLVYALPVIEGTVRQQLTHLNQLADQALADEALALVLDHLRRLPTCVDKPPGITRGQLPSSTAERPVSCFRLSVDVANSGERYLTWLTQRRTVDTIRRCQRERQRCRNFSALAQGQLARAQAANERGLRREAQQTEINDNRLAWIQRMLAELSPPDRLLMELVLKGKTLVVISHVLDCAEGTVSRRRKRIEAWLRRQALCADDDR